MSVELVNPTHQFLLGTVLSQSFQGVAGHTYHLRYHVVPVGSADVLIDGIWVCTASQSTGGSIAPTTNLVYAVAVDAIVTVEEGQKVYDIVLVGDQQLIHKLDAFNDNADGYLTGIDYS